MGRRSDHTPEQLKNLCLEAGRELVRTEGLHALTARAIAKRIGYSPGTLYNIFANLDELILHINAETLAKLQIALVDGLADQDDFAGALGQTYLDFIADHRPFWELLFETRYGGAFPDWYQQRVDRLFDVVERALGDHLDEAAAKRASRVLWAGLHGICILALSGKLAATGAEPPGELCRSLVENYLRGQAATASAGG